MHALRGLNNNNNIESEDWFLVSPGGDTGGGADTGVYKWGAFSAVFFFVDSCRKLDS